MKINSLLYLTRRIRRRKEVARRYPFSTLLLLVSWRNLCSRYVSRFNISPLWYYLIFMIKIAQKKKVEFLHTRGGGQPRIHRWFDWNALFLVPIVKCLINSPLWSKNTSYQTPKTFKFLWVQRSFSGENWRIFFS